MEQIKLYKKEGSYTDKKTGGMRPTVRFYLGLGDALIPIQPTYFENTELGRDPQFAARKAVMKAFAEPLPTKEGNAHGE